jgi:hypothetical protein
MREGRGNAKRITRLPVVSANRVVEVVRRASADNVIDLAEQREIREAAQENVDVSEYADACHETANHLMRDADHGSDHTRTILTRLSIRRSRAGVVYQRRTEVRESSEVA